MGCNCGNGGRCTVWIWAPNKLEELKGRRGLFEVPEKIGKKLLDAGLVQLPSEGANKLRPISDDEPVRKVVRKRKAKVVEEEEIETTEPVEQATLDVDSPEG